MPRVRGRDFPSWEVLADPDTARLNPSLPLGGLWVPNRVELVDGSLCFRWDGETDAYRNPPVGLLERFLRARHDHAILAFARHFGPLGVSELDGNIRPDPKRVFHRLSRGDEHREAVSSWCRYRQEFSDLLTLAAQLREGESIDREVFVRFKQREGVRRDLPKLAFLMALPWPTVVVGNWERMALSERRERAAQFLTHRCEILVESCGVRPVLAISPGRNRSDTVGELLFQDAIGTSAVPGLSLFGALTVQLLAAASGSRFSMCSACGMPFVPRRRKPAFGRRRYCPSCGRHAAQRDAKADYRSKLRRLGRKRLGRKSTA